MHTLQLLLSTIDNLHVCAGQPDAHFLEMAEAKKGTLKSINGSVAAYVDNNAPVEVDGKSYIKTLRSSGCLLLCTTSNSLVPRLSKRRGQKGEPGTHCLRMCQKFPDIGEFVFGQYSSVSATSPNSSNSVLFLSSL